MEEDEDDDEIKTKAKHLTYSYIEKQTSGLEDKRKVHAGFVWWSGEWSVW